MGAREPEGGGSPKRGAAEGAVNHRTRGTLRFAEQGLEVERFGRGSRFTPVSGRAVTARGHALAMSQGRLRVGRNPWTVRTLDVAAGCNRPAKPERGASRREAEKA
jgi:hypothetical protein